MGAFRGLYGYMEKSDREISGAYCIDLVIPGCSYLSFKKVEPLETDVTVISVPVTGVSSERTDWLIATRTVYVA